MPRLRNYATRLNPYLSFSGNAREAMEIYKSVFGGRLTGCFNKLAGGTIHHPLLETPWGCRGRDLPVYSGKLPSTVL